MNAIDAISVYFQSTAQLARLHSTTELVPQDVSSQSFNISSTYEAGKGVLGRTYETVDR